MKKRITVDAWEYWYRLEIQKIERLYRTWRRKHERLLHSERRG